MRAGSFGSPGGQPVTRSRMSTPIAPLNGPLAAHVSLGPIKLAVPGLSVFRLSRYRVSPPPGDADRKLAELDDLARRRATIHLGMPAFSTIAARTIATPATPQHDLP